MSWFITPRAPRPRRGSPTREYCATGDEDAPLSNLCLDRDGVWWCLAGGATNTNGKGGPIDNVPADSMNTYALGIEANGGYGEPWPSVQTSSYTQGVRALIDAYGIAHVRAHFEWAPDRKIDPAGPSPWATGSTSWDMDAFRADLAAPTPEPEPVPPATPVAVFHQEGDPMFIAVKNGQYWIGNGLGRRKMADPDELDSVIQAFHKAGTPLRNFNGGQAVNNSDDVSGAEQLHKLGLDVAG